MRDSEFIKPKKKANENGWLVKGLLKRKQMSMVAAPPGEGKSLFAEAIAYHVVFGAHFLGMLVVPGNVLFIDSENSHLSGRLARIKKGLENDGCKKQGEMEIQHYSGFLLDDKCTWTEVEKVARDLHPVLIVYDHLRCFHHADEDKSGPMTGVCEAVEELAKPYESASLVLHHFRKGEGSFYSRLRGSSAIYAKTDAAYEVRTLEKKDGRLAKFGVIPQARKDVTPLSFRVRLEEGPDWLKLVHDGEYRPIDDPRMDRICHLIYDTFLQDKEKKTVFDVRDALSGLASDHETRTCLAELENLGFLSAERKERGGKFFYSLISGLTLCPWCSGT
jgi:hypothetical protein